MGLDISGAVGVFHMKGLESKVQPVPRNPRKTKLFGGISRDFCQEIPGMPNKFENKMAPGTRKYYF